MSSFANFLKDPPPSYAFELSQDGIAFAKTATPDQRGFQPFEGPVLTISPVHDNVQDADALKSALDKIVPQDGKKRRAALILPDYCARVAVLDFDNFPAGPDEQLALVRFRMKKSVPFDVETAVVSYCAQPRAMGTGNKNKIDVVVAIMAREIVTRYEAPFRAAAFQPGFVTTTSLAMLNSVKPDGLTVVRQAERTYAERDGAERQHAQAVPLRRDGVHIARRGGGGAASHVCLHRGRARCQGAASDALRVRSGHPGRGAGMAGAMECGD